MSRSVHMHLSYALLFLPVASIVATSTPGIDFHQQENVVVHADGSTITDHKLEPVNKHTGAGEPTAETGLIRSERPEVLVAANPVDTTHDSAYKKYGPNRDAKAAPPPAVVKAAQQAVEAKAKAQAEAEAVAEAKAEEAAIAKVEANAEARAAAAAGQPIEGQPTAISDDDLSSEIRTTTSDDDKAVLTVTKGELRWILGSVFLVICAAISFLFGFYFRQHQFPRKPLGKKGSAAKADPEADPLGQPDDEWYGESAPLFPQEEEEEEAKEEEQEAYPAQEVQGLSLWNDEWDEHAQAEADADAAFLESTEGAESKRPSIPSGVETKRGSAQLAAPAAEEEY